MPTNLNITIFDACVEYEKQDYMPYITYKSGQKI